MRESQTRRALALPQEIERIKSLDLLGLGLQWRNVFGKRAPGGLPRALLIKILIHRLQVDVLGDLDPKLARLLETYAARGAGEACEVSTTGQGRTVSEPLMIKPGSVLVRDWGGRSHRVMTLEVGFAWEGRNYRSLSEVARAITGTRWNGRRFFGVDQKADRGSRSLEVRRGMARASELIDGGGK